jgi:excinuclease ABC subunit A
VRVRGARVHNLRSVDVELPRDALVVFTGVSGSGKSSLAFGTLYAEAQRRYLESVAPYARRLFEQQGVPDVDAIDGLPPAVALQQQRGAPTTRSSVGSVTTLSNLLRMLYSRAGDYPRGAAELHAEAFSPNTPEGACPRCHGLGRIYDATERSMVPDDALTIRERAIAAWPPAWHGQNQRDILVTLGHDVDRPWRELPRKTRDWILFTDEQPWCPVYPGYTPARHARAARRKEPPAYMGTFTSARRYVLHTFATTQSPMVKRRVARYLVHDDCPACGGRRLRPEPLAVRFAGWTSPRCRACRSIASRPSSARWHAATPERPTRTTEHPERAMVARRIAQDLVPLARAARPRPRLPLAGAQHAPTLSPGRAAAPAASPTQVRSNLFGVVYVLDEPSAGPAPGRHRGAVGRARPAEGGRGNKLFVVEHDLDVVAARRLDRRRRARGGGSTGAAPYSGPPGGARARGRRRARAATCSRAAGRAAPSARARAWLDASRRDAQQPARPRRALPARRLHHGHRRVGLGEVEPRQPGAGGTRERGARTGRRGRRRAGGRREALERRPVQTGGGRITGGMDGVRRLVRVDQKPIGRTPRSNLATYTGLFDHVRRLFAATKQARARRYDAGRFSFNVAKGRCPTCEGEGFVSVELLFLASVYAPCPTCHGTRYDARTLEVTWRGGTWPRCWR